MTVRPARRLPGIRFEAQAPQLDEVLPRMDIAVFVGFASRGPRQVPVAIESAVEFERIFGGDAPLAWDPAKGETVYARLAPAVRAFFRNGGARCWVVRVTGESTANFFPVPGLVRLSADGMTPAFARARSDGCWSDGLRVGSAIAPVRVGVLRMSRLGDRVTVDATLASPDDLTAGDLLRLELAGGYVVMAAITETTSVETSPPSARPTFRATGGAVWFRTSAPPPSASTGALAVVYTAARRPSGLDETFASAPVPIANPDWTSVTTDGLLRLDLRMAPEDVPEPGALVSVDTGTEQLWLTVRNVGVVGDQASGTDRVRVAGTGLWWLKRAPEVALDVERADRIALELWVRRREDQVLALRDLGLVPDYPRYWANLRHDDGRYGASEEDSVAQGGLALEDQFPLAGAGPRNAFYFPLDAGLTPDCFLPAARQPLTGLERDGLAAYSPNLFLDPALIAPRSESLLGEADHARYTGASPRRLRGVHAALEIEEATIISVPDASHRGWISVGAEDPVPSQAPPDLLQPSSATFIACGTRVLEPPTWDPRFDTGGPVRFESGTYALDWQGHPDDQFIVEEARRSDWSDASVIYSGRDRRLKIYGRPAGSYYHRVRAVDRSRTSNWSRGLIVTVAAPRQWRVVDARAYAADSLLVVHRALLRMAAARGDLFALLTVPEHFRADDAIAHVRLLKSAAGPVIPVRVDEHHAPFSLPAGIDEARVFSYGALYHPWLLVREQPGDASLTLVPPDGSVAGLFAHRALTRGAWIAPANDALSGIVAALPAVARGERQRLLDAQVNAIAQDARGFLPLSADTLTDDPDLLPINVRRLLSLLRRLAVREGTAYVFEPHDAAFERLVHRGFESFLTHMFERGAFAGATAASAFQVDTSLSRTRDPRGSEGRFVVELKVAPSLPMSFLTVRLVQSGDRTLVTEER